MQIVIDIPIKTIEHIRSDYGHGYRGFYDNDRDLIMKAIYDCIVLPKGHGDLIDRKDLFVTPIDVTDLPTDKCLMVYYAEDIEDAPTIIPADKEGD